MDFQLAALKIQEMQKRQQLAEKQDLIQLSASADWDKQLREYLEDLRSGVESLNAAPDNDEEWREIFELKKMFIQSLVEKVEITKDRQLNVILRLKVLGVTQHSSEISAIKPV